MNTLKVQRRDMAQKAKKLRREGFVTGSMYGKGFEGSIPLVIPQKEAERIQRECLKGSQLNLELDGQTYDVLLKEIDYNALKRQINEMDFQALVKGEKVHVTTEIVLENKDKVQVGVVEQLLEEVAYKAFPEGILDRIEVDCTSLKLGQTLTVGELEIANDKDIEITTHLDTPVVSVIAPKNADIPADEESAAE